MADSPSGAENYRHIIEIRKAIADLYQSSRAHGHKIDSLGTALNLEHDLRSRMDDKLDDLTQWKTTELALRRRAIEELERQAPPAQWQWQWILVVLGSMVAGAWLLIQLQAAL